MHFISLPTEIHLTICDNLSYHDTVSLASTCSYVKPLLVSHLYTRAAKDVYLPALHWASFHHQPDAVAMLLERGFRSHINDKDENNITALMLAACTRSRSLPLLHYTSYCDSESTEVKLEFWDLRDPVNNYVHQLETVRVLLDHGARPDEVAGVHMTMYWDRVRTTLQPTALHLAMANKDRDASDIVELLLTYGADPNITSVGCKKPPISMAFEAGLDGIFKALVTAGAALLCPGESEGYTVLHKAVVKGCTETVRLLLDHGAPVDVMSRYGHTPLAYACVYGQVEIARLLIDAGAQLSITDDWGFSPLHLAVIRGAFLGASSKRQKVDPSVVNLLLERGMDANLPIEANNGARLAGTPSVPGTHWNTSQMWDDMEGLEFVCGDTGVTPLLLCCKNTSPAIDSSDIAQVLLVNGADTAVRWSGFTALHYASARNDSELTRILLEHGAEVDIEDGIDGATPLAVAARCPFAYDEMNHKWRNKEPRPRDYCPPPLDLSYYGHLYNSNLQPTSQETVLPLESMEVLLEHGASIEALDKHRNTVFLHAASYCCVLQASLEFLRDNGANVDARGPDGGNALMQRLILTDVLLYLGVKSHVPDNNGVTPLMLACSEGDLEDVRSLVKHRARLGAKDKDGLSALHYAATYRITQQQTWIKEILDILLLRRKHTIDVPSNDGTTPLMAACENWNAVTVSHLLKCGADMQKRAKDGSTALHRAASSRVAEDRKTPIVQVLHHLRALDIDARDKNGATPLLLACQVGRLHVVEKLLNMCPDISLVDNNGLGPIAAAELTRDATKAQILSDTAIPCYTTINDIEKILQLLRDYQTMYGTAKPKPTKKSAATQEKAKSSHKQKKPPKPRITPSPSRSPSPDTVAVGGWNLRQRKAKN